MYQLIEDYTDPNSGELYWIDQSPDVEWETSSIYSGKRAAIEREQDSRGDKGLEKGETIIAKPVFPDGKRPTIKDWLKELESEEGPKPLDAPPGARKVTKDELMDGKEAQAKRRREMREKRLSQNRDSL